MCGRIRARVRSTTPILAGMAEKELANLSNVGFDLSELLIYIVFLLV